MNADFTLLTTSLWPNLKGHFVDFRDSVKANSAATHPGPFPIPN
jgi:spore maturation protein CgeB